MITAESHESAGATSGGAGWLIAARGCMLSLLLAAVSIIYVWSPQSYRDGFHLLYVPIGVFFVLTFASAAWLRVKGDSVAFRGSQCLLDLTLVTVIVYATGGAVSPLLFLYLPLVMAAAAVTTQRGGVLMALASAFSYVCMVIALQQGWLTPLGTGGVAGIPVMGLTLQTFSLAGGMVLVAFLTGYLTRRARTTFSAVEQQRLALSSLSQHQRSMIDGLSDGLVATSMEEQVVAANEAACRLLGIHENDVVGRPLGKLLAKLDPSFKAERVAALDYESREIVRTRSDGGEDRIGFQQRPLIDAERTQQGWIFVFQNVTKLRSMEEQLALQERMARLLAERSDTTPLVTATKLKDFVGESPVMQKLFALIERVAPTDATVLVSGESGTGKELVARAIHLGGPRAGGPFVAVNCGAIPETLIESELFGHKKGAFTGADHDHPGLIRKAENGTLFLDEIGELPLQMQSKLLRVIQERQVRPVGGERDFPVNVRLIAATNRNLKKEISEGRFREDLFYRLNVIALSIPALRTRKDDIPLLVRSLLSNLVPPDRMPVVSPEALRLLMQYDYPGNVRELENILERAVVLGSDAILPEHLPDLQEGVRGTRASDPMMRGPLRETHVIVDDEIAFPVELDQILASIERRYLELALNQSNGVKKRAAELLGLNFRSFRYRLQKFGIADEL